MNPFPNPFIIQKVIAYIFSLGTNNADGLVQAVPKIDLPDDLRFNSDDTLESRE
jgi:hypothetical protein